MLSFESSLSNTVDDDDDDDDDLSGFLLGLPTSRAALCGSWVLDFHQAGNPILASISRLLRHAGDDSGSILLTPNSIQKRNDWQYR